MKLSEIKGERALEVIADLIEPITNIASDKNCKGAFVTHPEEGETNEEAVARNIKEKIPTLLKSHKKDLVNIVGTLEGKNAEELSLIEITHSVLEMLNDKALLQLFFSAGQTAEATLPQEDCKK